MAAGGGANHRRGLGDGVLIKDNHIEALRGQGMSLGETVGKARANAPHSLKIEVEIEDPNDVEEAISAGADILLLDNMSTTDMSSAVKLAGGRVLIEASGRVSLGNVREVASTGVDLISVGALTHSSRALDIGLELTG